MLMLLRGQERLEQKQLICSNLSFMPNSVSVAANELQSTCASAILQQQIVRRQHNVVHA